MNENDFKLTIEETKNLNNKLKNISIYDQLDKPMVNVVKTADKLGIKTTHSCSGHEGGSLYPYIAIRPEENKKIIDFISEEIGFDAKEEFFNIRILYEFANNFDCIPENYFLFFEIDHLSNGQYSFNLRSKFDGITEPKGFMINYPQEEKDKIIETIFIGLIELLYEKGV